ncbi:2-hydroxyacid dehydrogenase [Jannaschia aquimarina]|uniref:GhrB protein n=1 Tax=Jannaschia aquimarina TaxID=935700 RepID=A0A0D1CKH1_9RHOB|nr:2-hydroxyacid dehydrogenase [Jannaschia aquimarina]KIT15247.1 Glyoxylate/hydroxypyruvate reductase B [Jannaschia aquimarina]SNT32314.1 Lactate dehydrogenase [Jannaschia aquimarina]
MAKMPLLQIGGITDDMATKLETDFAPFPLLEQEDRAAFLADRGAEFEAILTNGHYGVPDDVAAATPNLKVVSSYGVGYDAIDADAFAERGILISHTPGVLNDEVAVTAISLWLAVYRALVPADAHARSGAWEKGEFPLTRSPMDRKVGILGLGRIGETIAAMVKAFRAEVHYHSRSKKDVPYTYHATPAALGEAVDVLIVITPGGPETQHIVDAEVLAALGKGGCLINVSRGSTVDEAALIEALQNGTIAGAGLDVFEHEPKIPQALKDMPERVVLLPHVGSATMETRAAMGDLTVRNLLQWKKDGTVETPVPECRVLNG